MGRPVQLYTVSRAETSTTRAKDPELMSTRLTIAGNVNPSNSITLFL